MPARLYPQPSNVVFDRSTEGTITLITQGTHTETGTINNIIDKDLTTSYKSASTGAEATRETTIKFDYGKVLWNCQLFYKFALNSAQSCYVRYSTDNTNWTNLEAAGGGISGTDAYQIISMRYLEFTAINTAGGAVDAEVFECRLMGS